MKSLIIISSFLLSLSSCVAPKRMVKQVCNLGIDTVEVEMAGRKPPKNDTTTNPIINPDNPESWPVAYIDFDGDTVVNTRWNYNGLPIICLPAGLDSTGRRLVVENVEEDFARFWYIRVTTSDSLFKATPVNKRQKIIVTSSTPLGVSSGQAMLNSFGTGDPAFVQTTYTVTIKKAKEATSHELGHCFGLYHQSEWSGSVKIAEYLMGVIMGNGYYVPFPGWIVGTNSIGRRQDDMAVIDKKLVRRKP